MVCGGNGDVPPIGRKNGEHRPYVLTTDVALPEGIDSKGMAKDIQMLDIIRRRAATYASRSAMPIEIVRLFCGMLIYPQHKDISVK